MKSAPKMEKRSPQSLRRRGLLTSPQLVAAVCSGVQQQKSVLCLKSLKYCLWKRSSPGGKAPSLASCFSGSVPSWTLMPGIKFMSQASTKFLNEGNTLGRARGRFVMWSENFSSLLLKPSRAGQRAIPFSRSSLRSMAIV